MAKFETRLRGNFDTVLARLDQGILEGSYSASYEDGSDWRLDHVRCAVRVYERYSVAGNNRVSLTLTLLGDGEELYLSAITAGGSQAMFWKFNTWGEETFLEKLRELVDAL